MHLRRNCQGHVWLLSGTGEGPKLAKALIQEGWSVTVSVVSFQASISYSDLSLEKLKIGLLEGVKEIVKVLEDSELDHQGFDWVLDATHPFAELISSSLREACEYLSQPLVRYERPQEDLDKGILISDLSPSFNVPEGDYQISIYSDNLYPEIFDINLSDDMSIDIDCKWKSTVLFDDFSTLEDWTNQSWAIDQGVLKSQSDFLYSNSLDNAIVSNAYLEQNQNYVLSINHMYEIEWDNDNFNIYTSCNNCEDELIVNLSGHNYDWHNLKVPFSIDNEDKNLKLNFVSDASLDYRGVKIEDLSVYKKPELSVIILI